MNRYRPHDALIAPARNSAALWRLLVGIAVIAVTFIAMNLAWYGLIRTLPDAEQVFAEVVDGTTARGMSWLLGSFLCLLIALGLALSIVHRRSVLSLMGPVGPSLRQGGQVFAFALAVYLVVFMVPLPDPLQPEQAMPWGRWLALLPLSMGLLILQCGTEELVFRGYLQSQLAARFSSPWVWMMLPSLLFAALHYEPAVYGEVAIWMAVWAGLFGVVAADLTARSGTLGPAIALHLVNNFMAISITSMAGHWDGLALFTLPISPGDSDVLMMLMPLEAGLLFCGWLAARIAVRR